MKSIRLLLIALAFAGLNASFVLNPEWIASDIQAMINLTLSTFLVIETLWQAKTPKKADKKASTPDSN